MTADPSSARRSLHRRAMLIGAVLCAVLAVSNNAVAYATDDGSDENVTVTVMEDIVDTPPAQPAQAGLGVGVSGLVIAGVERSVKRETGANQVGLIFTFDGYRLEITGRDVDGSPMRLDADGNLVVEAGGSFLVRGSGFQASTPAAIYLFSSPTLLGRATADTSGTFTTVVGLPSATTAGVHNLQVVGYVATNRLATLTTGVSVSVRSVSGSNGGASYSAAPSGTSGVTVEQSSSTAPSDAPVTDAPGTLELGVFAISALQAVAEPSLSVGGGAVRLAFTVRNTSTTPFDATAAFRLDARLGPQIASIDGVAIDALQPGEIREVAVRIEDVGNWAFYRGYVTFTPPEVVEKTELTPVTREADVLVPPPAALPAVVALGVGAIAAVMWLAATGRLLPLIGFRRRDDEDEGEDVDRPDGHGADDRDLVGAGGSQR